MDEGDVFGRQGENVIHCLPELDDPINQAPLKERFLLQQIVREPFPDPDIFAAEYNLALVLRMLLPPEILH